MAFFFNRNTNSFNHFMLNEINKYSPDYAKKKVRIHEVKDTLRNNCKGGVLAFLHFGSFFLSGFALKEILNIDYTAVASKNNLQFLSVEETRFWNNVHEKMKFLYSREMFFTTDNPRNLINWLNNNNYLGVALDVNEKGRKNKFSPFTFLGKKIYLQTGAARLARITKKPLISMTIRYSPLLKKHTVFLGNSQFVDNEIVSTQKALNEMELHIKGFEYQFFHDILNLFKFENTNK